jgi:hypothetical protein
MLALGLVSEALSEDEPLPVGARPAASELQEFFKLNDKLPKAVCDENMIARAPSLESLNERGADGARVVPAQLDPGASLEFEVRITEAELIGFMLADRFTLVAAPHIRTLLQEQVEASEQDQKKGAAAQLARIRKQIALDVCISLVTPGKLKQLMSSSPSWFLPPASVSATLPIAVPGKGKAVFRVLDPEGRFGKIGQKWWIAGWLEPYEVSSVRIGKREYRRLANPVTNLTQSIEIVGRDELPLGQIFPTTDEPKKDWEQLRSASQTDGAKQRRGETYRLMIERDAYFAIARFPAQAEAIRKLQDYFKSQLGSYQIYPDEAQFDQFAKSQKSMMSESEIRGVLDSAFFESLGSARVNGAKVGLQIFKPDPKLHGLYKEYQRRLGLLR